MSGLVHLRVDNRLLHGQVVQFWIGHLEIDHLIVADDDVAQNEAMPMIYRMALPDAVGLAVTCVHNVVDELKRNQKHNTLVLIRDVFDLARAFIAGATFKKITLGNVHTAKGRKRITDSVYLSPEEIQSLGEMKRRGIPVEIQTFPGEVLRLEPKSDGGWHWSRH